MRQSNTNPKVSAYEQLEGTFDFNKTPLVPPGTKVIAHEKPSQRGTWAPHGIDAWYLGPALEHYRCYQIYAAKSGGERVSDTVEFFPHDIPMLHKLIAEIAIQAATELATAIENLIQRHRSVRLVKNS